MNESSLKAIEDRLDSEDEPDAVWFVETIQRLVEAVRSLQAQLPENMKHCTIQCKTCGKGHGWLTATNWVQHGCPTCAIEAARQEERAKVADDLERRAKEDWEMANALHPNDDSKRALGFRAIGLEDAAEAITNKVHSTEGTQ